jgi:hypothetical protein
MLLTHALPYVRPTLRLHLRREHRVALYLPPGRHLDQLQILRGRDIHPGFAARTAVVRRRDPVVDRIAVARRRSPVAGHHTLLPMSRCHDAFCDVRVSHLGAKAAGHMSLAHSPAVVDRSLAVAADGLGRKNLVVHDTAPGSDIRLAGSVVRTDPGLGRRIDLAGRIRLDRRVRTYWMEFEMR